MPDSKISEAPYRATGFHMIRTLKVEHFRCFRAEKLEDLRRINIIVGDNGSGKTGLLESILLAAGPSPALVFRLRQWRGFEGQVTGQSKDVEEALWSDLFYQFDRSKGVSIDARGDTEHTRRLTITHAQRPVTYPIGVKVADYTPSNASVKFRWNVSNTSRPIEITPRIDETGIKIPPAPESATETFFFAANHTYSSVEAASRLSRLSRRSVEGEVIEHFRKHYPNVEDLSLNLSAGTPMIFAKLFGFRERIPLNLVSGGMNKLAAILFSFPTAPKCTVLIDEIENGFYFRKLPEIWATLLAFCSQYDAQIFATTHSEECLMAASSVAEQSPENFSIIHVGKNGSLHQFYGAQFTEAMKENIEIR